MTISIALDKLDLKPYNLIQICRRDIALRCFLLWKNLKSRQRTTMARYIFQHCKNIFVSSTKRWIRTREKGLKKNRGILYSCYRNKPEDLQRLQQKFDYCTTAGSFRISLIYTKKNTELVFLLTVLAGFKCYFIILWLKGYLTILWYDALK